MTETHASPATWRFLVAPMMDGTDRVEKSCRTVVVLTH
jgi:hypothetical protein